MQARRSRGGRALRRGGRDRRKRRDRVPRRHRQGDVGRGVRSRARRQPQRRPPERPRRAPRDRPPGRPRGGRLVRVCPSSTGSAQRPTRCRRRASRQFGRALRVELAQHGAGASVAYFGFIDTHMVHQTVDGDSAIGDGGEALPAVLRKRLPPSAAGAAIVRGIERRAPRIIRPRRWAVISTMRGIFNPVVDRYMARDAEVQADRRRARRPRLPRSSRPPPSRISCAGTGGAGAPRSPRPAARR